MLLALIIKPDQLSRYGEIPEPPEKSNSAAEVHRYSFDDAMLLNDDFVDSINELF